MSSVVAYVLTSSAERMNSVTCSHLGSVDTRRSRLGQLSQTSPRARPVVVRAIALDRFRADLLIIATHRSFGCGSDDFDRDSEQHQSEKGAAKHVEGPRTVLEVIK